MIPKDRILMALNHEYPDRIPKHCSFTPEIAKEFKSIFKISDDNPYSLDLLFGHDFLQYEIGFGKVWGLEDNTEITFGKKDIFYDEYGIGWKKVHYQNGSYIEMVHHPLAKDVDLIENLELPNVSTKSYKELEVLIKKYGDYYGIMGGISSTIFEPAWYLRGQQQFLIDLIENPEMADNLMTKILDYHLNISKKMVEMGADLIFLGDDVGTQDRPMISREMIHKFLTPKYSTITSELRKINSDVKFAFHCCGYIDHLLPELIEAGVDIVQVLQPGSVNFIDVKKKFGKNISFWGGIDVQKLIPDASLQEVVAAIRFALEVLGENGGYIMGMTHNVQPGPRAIENTIMSYYAIEKYGNYKRSA